MQYASVVFDFDSTVVNTETFELLAEEALKEVSNREETLNAFQAITNQGMAGEIPLEESFRRRMALVSLSKKHIDAIVPHMIERLSPSFSRNLDFFEKHGKRCFIVSGGFIDLIYPVSDYLGIAREHVHANQFVFDASGKVIGLDTTRPTCRAGGKALQIRALNLEQPSVMIGDGMTDYEAKHQGGVTTFIAYTEFARREKVCALSDKCAGSLDEVRELLRH
ncbi:MAG: hypothetical protein RI911_428 [Candidatus Parcubacteria bacterium]